MKENNHKESPDEEDVKSSSIGGMMNIIDSINNGKTSEGNNHSIYNNSPNSIHTPSSIRNSQIQKSDNKNKSSENSENLDLTTALSSFKNELNNNSKKIDELRAEMKAGNENIIQKIDGVTAELKALNREIKTGLKSVSDSIKDSSKNTNYYYPLGILIIVYLLYNVFEYFKKK